MIYTYAGLLLASVIYFFGFSKLAKKNIQRIRDLAGKNHSIITFQKWSSYPLVLVMVSLGIYLRKYSPFPKHLLGTAYIGIGGGLLFSSLHYYLYLLSEWDLKKDPQPD